MSIFGSKQPKLLGIHLGGKCSGRPGIIEIRDDKTNQWSAFAYTDPARKHPKVVECEHQGIQVIAESMEDLITRAKEKADSDSDFDLSDFIGKLPKPSDFRYTFVDVEPAELDAEVPHTHDAASILAKVMGGAA